MCRKMPTKLQVNSRVGQEDIGRTSAKRRYWNAETKIVLRMSRLFLCQSLAHHYSTNDGVGRQFRRVERDWPLGLDRLCRLSFLGDLCLCTPMGKLLASFILFPIFNIEIVMLGSNIIVRSK